MEFPRQEYWSGLPWPSPGESSQPRKHLLHLLNWQMDALPRTTWKARMLSYLSLNKVFSTQTSMIYIQWEITLDYILVMAPGYE